MEGGGGGEGEEEEGEGRNGVSNGDHSSKDSNEEEEEEEEENLFDRNKPVTDSKRNSQFGASREKNQSQGERGGRGTVGVGVKGQQTKDREILFHSKEEEVMDMLQRNLQEKSAALVERETQLQVMKKERFELGVRVQKLQREVSVANARSSRLEQELLLKEAEIQRLRLSGQSEWVLNTM